MHRRDEAESKFMRPFGLGLPEKARSPISCLVFQLSNGSNIVTCPYFTALRDANGQVLRCYKLEESPARYVLHCESHVLPNVLNGPTVETVWTKDEGTLTHSSILAVNGGLLLYFGSTQHRYHTRCSASTTDIKMAMSLDPNTILEELRKNFVQIARFTSQTHPTHKFVLLLTHAHPMTL